ncbi:glycine cleavage protein H-like protein [Candidatus Chlamydia sanziniae]|uniref:Glycine cleavage system H-like protein n=1 Tax=Candidatus Chlamydia sanziniae TaxID=1806891 RepID=A0A1A9HZ05_9CHLA|nr:glycine cleavage protein H-like protein [Candidatus Chlamydia sanziniae]ANH79166.1 putative not a Glycine cleavage system H protein [Candidatus Chlamydia sanziniae]
MWYSDYHVWILPIHNRLVRLGLTKKMQTHLGMILHVDLPSIGSSCKKGDVLGILESSKSAIEVLSPVSGEILDVNQVLTENPKELNESPEEKGWLAIMRLDGELDTAQFSSSEE